VTQTLLALLVSAALWAQAPGEERRPGSRRSPGLYATLNTTLGSITFRLHEKESPETVKNFVALVRGEKPWKDPGTGRMVTRPLYDGILIHRVIPNFMIQMGDPEGTGSGDCGIKPVRDEWDRSFLKFDSPGQVAMASSGPGTSTCQFFIAEMPLLQLNNMHTIFGQVVEGRDVVSKIARVPRDRNDKPRTPVKVVTVIIEREGPEPGQKDGLK